MEFAGSVKGIYNLDKVFSNLPRSTRRKAVIPALRKGAEIIKRMASENVQRVVSNEATGTLAKGIKVYNSRARKGNMSVVVQVQRGLHNQKKIVNGVPVRVGLYAGVLEYRESGRYSWMRKALNEGEKQAQSTMTSELNKRMVDAVKDAGGR